MTVASAALLPEPRSLVPSGIETLSADMGGYWRAVVDGRGMVWALGSERLARYDPGTGALASWSVDDDVRFGANDIVPSVAGGVWLVGAHALRLFDGSGFGTAYDTGARVTAATEAPDGSVWAATADGIVVRLAGAEETRIDGLGPGDASIAAIAVDARGEAWCAWAESNAGWLARYDGSAWRVYDRDDAAPLEIPATGLIVLAGGEVWAATQLGLARFDGQRWTVPAMGTSSFAPEALGRGPEDTVWVAAGHKLGRFAGDTWRTFAPLDDQISPGASSIALTRHGVFVAGNGVLYQRAGDTWQQVLPVRAPRSTDPGYASALVAISRDEAWVGGTDAAGSGAVWHVVGGAWASSFHVGSFVRHVLRTPDGSLWAAVDGTSPSILRGTEWVSVGGPAGDGLAVDSHGVVWVAGSDGGAAWSVRAYGLVGGRWLERARTAATDLVAWPAHLAVAGDGTIWVGTIGPYGIRPGLLRYANGAWAMVDPRGGDGYVPVTDVVAAPNGDVWVAGMDPPVEGAPPASWVARFDGANWSVFRPHQGLGVAGDDPASYYEALDLGPDGTVWLATGVGLFRYDGRAWSLIHQGIGFGDVSVAGDGTVWAIGPSGVARLDAPVPSR